MTVKRIVPNIASDRPDLCRDFYVGLLGLRAAMDLGWVATYASPVSPTAQISVVRAGRGEEVGPTISVEVEDVDRAHADAVRLGYRVVRPLADEPWGVRRSWVEDPDGVVINVLSHRGPAPDG